MSLDLISRAQLMTVARGIFIVAALLSFCAPARASGAEGIAHALFEAGLAAYRSGDYSAAARAFEEANEHLPSGATAYNAGVAWQLAAAAARAATAFEHALKLTAPEPQRTDARARLAGLSPQLGRLELAGSARTAIEIPGVGSAKLPAVIYVDPGEYDCVASYASGAQESRRVVVQQGQSVALIFSDAGPPMTPERESRSAPPSASFARTLGFASLGASAAAAGIALVLGSQGLGAREDFEASGRTDAAARDTALRRRTEANVAWITGAVLATGGIVLLLTSSDPGEQTRKVSSSSRLALQLGPMSAQCFGVF